MFVSMAANVITHFLLDKILQSSATSCGEREMHTASAEI